MNDQLIFNNYLLLLKSTVEVYVHGTLESSNQDVRETLKKCLNETMSMQSSIYDLMVENSWYQVNNISNKIIEKAIQNMQSN